jgi:hypothetical protein
MQLKNGSKIVEDRGLLAIGEESQRVTADSDSAPANGAPGAEQVTASLELDFHSRLR